MDTTPNQVLWQTVTPGALVQQTKIDYTNYLLDKPQETDPAKLTDMKAALIHALKEKGLHGHISCVYYTDGRIKVSINDEYYNIFDSNTGRFFSGDVGDEGRMK